MTTDDRAQFLRQGENHVEIGDGQTFLPPPLDPSLRLVSLTLRATAVLARVVRVLPMSAAVAAIDMTAQDFRATRTDVVQSATVAGQHRSAELLQIGIPVQTEDVCDFQHGRP